MGTETCGLGPCQVTVEVCVEGVLQECVPLRPEEFMERSCTDGIDNDCDGNIDYEDLNCKGRVDAGDLIDGQLTGGGCGCGSTDTGGLGLLLALLGLLIVRRNM
jgi:MYXO-CTERM domain-containing protein